MPEKLRDCVAIAVWFTIPVLLLRPFQNVPFVDDWVYAWAAAALSCAACAIRVAGVVLPMVIGGALVFDSERWGRRPTRLAAAIVPLIFLAGLLWWYRSHVFQTADLTYWQEAPANRIANLK